MQFLALCLVAYAGWECCRRLTYQTIFLLGASIGDLKNLNYLIAGNSMICGLKSGDNCSSVSLDELSYPPYDLKIQPQQGMARSHRIAIVCRATVGSVVFVVIAVSMLLWWRHRRNQQIFSDVNGNSLVDVVVDHTSTGWSRISVNRRLCCSRS